MFPLFHISYYMNITKYKAIVCVRACARVYIVCGKEKIMTAGNLGKIFNRGLKRNQNTVLGIESRTQVRCSNQ